MQIQKINSDIIKNSSNPVKPYINQRILYNKSDCVSFSSNKIIRSKDDELAFKEFLHSSGKVTFEEYNQICKNNPDILHYASKYAIKGIVKNGIMQIPQDCAEIVKIFKNNLDDSYSENGYTILSVGTSPAFITEPLSAMGVDVIFVPVSGVNITPKVYDLNNYLKKYPKAKTVSDYIYDKVSKRDFENGKKIIIMDFSSSGSTMRLIRSILHSYCKIPNKSIDEFEIGRFLSDLYNGQYKPCLRDILIEKVDKLTNVVHYYIPNNTSFEEIRVRYFFSPEKEKEKYKNFENSSKPLARAFQLVVLNDIYGLK